MVLVEIGYFTLKPENLDFITLLKMSIQYNPKVIWCIIVDEIPIRNDRMSDETKT